jgi:hypothetical protein
MSPCLPPIIVFPLSLLCDHKFCLYFVSSKKIEEYCTLVPYERVCSLHSTRCRSAEATLAEEQQARADQARDLGTQVDALARRAQQRSTVTDMAQEKLGEERKLRAQGRKQRITHEVSGSR